ncbi:hypothetical protein, partial [Okeania sp. SIO2B3]|uniref:hypothetical protein n=1 Tax=Okeania sp. SIO2B3 TaxID=2607784 RepID=UPI0013C28F2F
QSEDEESIAQLRQQTKQLLADIRYRFVTVAGVVSEEIISVAQIAPTNIRDIKFFIFVSSFFSNWTKVELDKSMPCTIRA